MFKPFGRPDAKQSTENKHLQWKTVNQEAFQRLKDILTTPEVLVNFRKDMGSVISCEWSIFKTSILIMFQFTQIMEKESWQN